MRRVSMAQTPTSPTNQISWLECAKWLNDCGVLPENLRSKLKVNILTIDELAYALRDGIVLCNLINNLIPSAIESSLIQRRANSRLACIKNITLFLEACKEEFDLIDQELFQAHMLYDLDIERVISALSKISKTKKCESMLARKGFDLNNENNDSDIYYNIKAVEETDYLYTADDAILSCDENDKIYQTIMQSDSNNDTTRKSATANFSKKDHVTREIYETENRYVKTLTSIINDFMKPMSLVLNDKDRKTIFTNIDKLKDMHASLLEEVTGAIKGGHGRTSRICKVFESYKEKLMKEYVDYFAGMKNASSKADALTTKSMEFKTKLEECRKKSEFGSFKLVDLLKIPYQRVLKYHLLFQELNRQTDDQHNAKKDIAMTYASMMDLASYLNESLRDHEMIELIEDLNSRLQEFSQNTLKDYGHLIKDDNVRVKEFGERLSKTRYLLLFEKALFICKSRGDNFNHKSTLSFNEYEIEDNRGFDSNNNANNLQINLYNNSDRSKVVSLLFKDEKQKNEWKTAIVNAIDKFLPKGYNQHDHYFLLTNFDRELINCGICKKVLYGILFQGYKCSKCSAIAHKGCILKSSRCTGLARVPNGMVHHIGRPSIPNADNKRLNKFIPYRVRALYQYQGRPTPPDYGRADCQVLTFKAGDLIQVTDDDDDDWWKGTKVSGNFTEGYFPKSYVQATKVDSYATRPSIGGNDSLSQITSNASLNHSEIKSIESSNWYCACERQQAEYILKRIETTVDSIFLVRPRQEGGYAVSIKSKSNDTYRVDHIRIHLTEFSADGKKTQVCLVEQNQFASVHELIQFYMRTKLEDNFPQVKTTLGIPYRQALPPALNEAIALHNFNPNNLNFANTGVEIELKEGEKYWVLSKESSGWWKVYNSDGLIGFVPGNYLKCFN